MKRLAFSPVFDQCEPRVTLDGSGDLVEPFDPSIIPDLTADIDISDQGNQINLTLEQDPTQWQITTMGQIQEDPSMD